MVKQQKSPPLIKTDKPLKLIIGDKTLEFPIIKGVEGPDVIDISKLYTESNAYL